MHTHIEGSGHSRIVVLGSSELLQFSILNITKYLICYIFVGMQHAMSLTKCKQELEHPLKMSNFVHYSEVANKSIVIF